MKERYSRAAFLMLAFSLLLEPVSLAAALSDDKGGYESQAAAKLKQSNELQSKIDSISDEKRAKRSSTRRTRASSRMRRSSPHCSRTTRRSRRS
ncbi:hypothetical protein [uncultured Mitsuokella sp.]|uniref:hypothetical protein n=1 Tax=uncultured Mitsuokella sp. TaxID=453120 RepID=UPI0025846F2E|nr:hypothetical protein [uncultured Mitsuokella sp.]